MVRTPILRYFVGACSYISGAGMAEHKKLSVADMLAAARKSSSGGAGDSGAGSSAPSEAAAADEGSTTTPPAEKPAAPAKKPAPTGGAGGRPSVAEMLAAAREGESSAAKKPDEKPPAPKPAPAAKPAAPKPAAAAAPSPDRETASVLGGAKKKDKPGPMSKAEAAALPAVPRAPAAPKIIVPPMPAKPEYAKPQAERAAVEKAAADADRRDFLGIGFWLLGAVSALWTLLTVKFMFPNVLREPPSKFKVGFPDAFPAGQVQEKFKAQYGVWVVNTEYNGKPEIFALKSVCTHLGCTPNWLEAEQKFKCPCHGSGFYKDGINFEAPLRVRWSDTPFGWPTTARLRSTRAASSRRRWGSGPTLRVSFPFERQRLSAVGQTVAQPSGDIWPIADNRLPTASCRHAQPE
jgi:cytochrome b6-f complex iron-sulfur subunit